MGKIHHVLKDGSEVPDVCGHVIKACDHPVLYETINRIQKEGETKKHETV